MQQLVNGEPWLSTRAGYTLHYGAGKLEDATLPTESNRQLEEGYVFKVVW